jgi:hypothetical protein
VEFAKVYSMVFILLKFTKSVVKTQKMESWENLKVDVITTTRIVSITRQSLSCSVDKVILLPYSIWRCFFP